MGGNLQENQVHVPNQTWGIRESKIRNKDGTITVINKLFWENIYGIHLMRLLVY